MRIIKDLPPSSYRVMTRTDRLLSIVLALQNQRWQRAEDLAALLGVSLRTIYRDMQALGVAGVPVVAVPGKGYRLAEDYVLPPLMLTTDEAVVLLLGSAEAAQHFDNRYRGAAQTAARKIRAVLPDEFGAEVTTLQESLRYVPGNVFDDPAEQARLQQLRRALAEQHTVRFRTAPRSADTGPAVNGDLAVHTVDPYGLLHRSGAWYLIGFCHRRRHVCDFRLGRMTDLAVLNTTFERPASYRFRSDAEAEERDVLVRVRFDAQAAPWLRSSPSRYVIDLEDLPDGLIATLKVQRETEVLPWLLGWGAHACVLEPDSLRRRLAGEAEKIAAQYQSDLLLLA